MLKHYLGCKIERKEKITHFSVSQPHLIESFFTSEWNVSLHESDINSHNINILHRNEDGKY